jgi:hypothetical protein
MVEKPLLNGTVGFGWIAEGCGLPKEQSADGIQSLDEWCEESKWPKK